MDAHLYFTGLQLLAPRKAAGGAPDTVHVVLPSTGGHHRHIPVLQFDSAYVVRPGATPPATVSGFPVRYLLRDRVLTVDGPGAKLDLCDAIVDLRGTTGMSIDPALLGNDPNTRATARVDLRTGAMDGVAPGFHWEWHEGSRHFAHVARWTVPLNPADPRLEIRIDGWHGNVNTQTLSLAPIAGTLEVWIEHLPVDESTPEMAPERPLPDEQTPAAHFIHYYDLYSGYGGPRYQPVFWHHLHATPATSTCTRLEPEQGASPANCMLAGDTD